MVHKLWTIWHAWLCQKIQGAWPCIEFATWISGRLWTLAKEGTDSFKIPIKMNPRTERWRSLFSLDFHADSSANQMTTASHTSQSKPPFNILLPVTIIGPRIIIAKWICKRNKIINHVTSSFISYNVNQVNTGRSCKPVRCITTTIDFLYFKQGFHSDSFSAI